MPDAFSCPIEKLHSGAVLARHQHGFGYVAIVMEGSYEEAGDSGRWHVSSGDVVVHRAFEAHRNIINPKGARVCNIPVRHTVQPPGTYRNVDIECLLQAASSRTMAAVDEILSGGQIKPSLFDYWPDDLADAIRTDPAIIFSEWAYAHSLSPSTLSRGFAKIYGTCPARYRSAVRTGRAMHAIATSASPLAQTAHDAGFADQAHMARAIKSHSGMTARKWSKVNLVQEGSAVS